MKHFTEKMVTGIIPVANGHSEILYSYSAQGIWSAAAAVVDAQNCIKAVMRIKMLQLATREITEAEVLILIEQQ